MHLRLKVSVIRALEKKFNKIYSCKLISITWKCYIGFVIS